MPHHSQRISQLGRDSVENCSYTQFKIVWYGHTIIKLKVISHTSTNASRTIFHISGFLEAERFKTARQARAVTYYATRVTPSSEKDSSVLRRAPWPWWPFSGRCPPRSKFSTSFLWSEGSSVHGSRKPVHGVKVWGFWNARVPGRAVEWGFLY